MKLLISAFGIPLALAMASGVPDPPRGSNLNLKVHCPGVDFKEVSAEDGATVGHVLTKSYRASRNKQIDDSSLTSVGFIGHELEGAPSHTRVQFHPAFFYGTFNCKHCYEDSDKEYHQEWERILAVELSTSGVQAFENVEDCKILYGLTGGLADVPANAKINLKCQGIRVNSLTVEESTFASHAVEATYNAVHREVPGDESHLGDVFVESSQQSMVFAESPDYLGYCWWGWGCDWLTALGGSYAPTFCYHDDIWWEDDEWYPGKFPKLMIPSLDEEDVTLTAEDVSKAWGDALAAKLRQGPFNVFHPIKSCEISLVVEGAVVEADVVVSTKKE